ncbi:ZIP family zinc transporter [Parabacteroides sp. PF5-5]|uniref:zinc transporter ZupT n=1 Tax=unclassified Parabacteroides TaxID=2649774 RepID=UPI002475EB7E|nr:MULTISPECIES: zinc transporter ZupT [unclassified Parabacteroides]MDH6306078.1 ZIP family zinc transporter [Parabacteroides sp. PH5-39]MDH6317024.1 ZIP family zinc transporter [Parabacteroides sp. PF5-13]MDH6320777.1 ZIP family zinc transporter [Parabacteroides sp. PH5-13]MDH6324521.1 ZIP family zinc transporter [Parabacteroides sp. PH5-8]MDH6328209.1 ZIP family zinc transporter [Parabacteroides sp. PH5-41]
MDTQTILTAFGLTLIAGLSTGIGSIMAFFTQRTNTKFLSTALGFSAGVMIYVSFMEMMSEAKAGLIEHFGERTGTLYLLLAFFGGMGFINLIDFLIPEDKNPHEMKDISELDKKQAGLKRTGLLVALSIGIHNFPEGIATFTSALNSLEVALPITFAIAIHNIPEGIAVSVPIYQATGNKKKAFFLSFLSGMAEPIGALVGFLILMPFWTPSINGFILAAVSGIMVFISMDELLPSAQKYGEHHLSILGLVAGMVVMAASLFLFI